MPTDLTSRFLKVVEAAAIAAARTVGQGDAHHSDRLAVEAMRRVLGEVPMRGRVVIGEGERDEAPMLHIGEEVGRSGGEDPRVDIAVDPLEGTNLCAKGKPGAIAVLAAAEEGGLLNAPDCYMQKLVVGPRSRGCIDLGAPTAKNLAGIAESLSRDVEDLVVVVLERPRHDRLVAEIREAGARIHLISDGDVTPALAACITGTGVHALMGIGAAPEGVISAAAVRCLGGDMQGRLVESRPGDRDRARGMGVSDFDRVYTAEEMAPGRQIVFAASGVTTGHLLRGVTYWGAGARTHSLVMSLEEPRRVRFVDTVHLEEGGVVNVRL
jgi:fructose-1,6-bisphosphatase class II